MNRGAALALLVAAAIGLLSASAAFASPYNRNCGKSTYGFLFGPGDAYEMHGPWHIKMSAKEARFLTPRFPPGEFGTHITQGQVPCIVAEAIAFSASLSWLNWPGNNGWSNVKADTYGGTTFIGTFYCAGTPLAGNGVVKLRCAYHKTVIVGSFSIYNYP